ncbi:MAG: zf-HC2 domain-containing protein [Planctomycetota bacterium]|nr:MAG: zf-HC2 domain-containing protein [Planctomycetota bacterium]
MYDRSRFLDAMRAARSSERTVCTAFQRDLSALFDGELPDGSARRALAHLESCPSCAEFFQAVRLQALAHQDLAVPGSLARRLRRLRGEGLFEGLSDAEILRRLAHALYQLGKAYVLLANDGDYLLRVAEEPVEIDSFERTEAAEVARAARAVGACRIDPDDLRRRCDDHLREGRRLLDEALKLKPRFAEARLYSGFVHQLLGEADQAAAEYREVFLRTDRPVNRAHAAIQLGLLYDRQGDHRSALRMYRWVVASGLLRRRPEFAFVLYNIAVEHLSLDDLAAAVAMLRRIRLGHPEVWRQVPGWLRQAPELLSRLRQDRAFRLEIEASEPAFFAA